MVPWMVNMIGSEPAGQDSIPGHHIVTSDTKCTVFGVSLLRMNCGVCKSVTNSDTKCTVLGH
jgi:hypothetical protein